MTRTNTKKRYDISKLKSLDVRKKYNHEVRNRFQVLEEGEWTIAEVKRTLKKKQNEKSTGIDSVTPKRLKTDIDVIAEKMAEIFNSYWRKKHCHQTGKGLICKIFKKGYMKDFIDWIMRKTTADKARGIRWNFNTVLEDLDFADYLALLSLKLSDLDEKTQKLTTEAEKVGNKLNPKKMITLYKEKLKEVDKFIYIEAVMDKEEGEVAKSRTEYRKRERDDNSYVALHWVHEGKQTRGKPKTTFWRKTEKERNQQGWTSWNVARAATKDRKGRKSSVAALCDF
ncbi:unnamed protein product [Mytilus edulis]|uniref:Uncharacterized protein n=1 Tax=Mytilus edulis TaxID=6550 RepID=A0A8S3UNG0_MYTED|nr:unnamed protein product [Mytilus edulis]